MDVESGISNLMEGVVVFLESSKKWFGILVDVLVG